MDQILDVLKHAVECSVCLDNLKDARSLRCNHAFCSECLRKLVRTEQDPDNAETIDRYIPCPQCREDHWFAERESEDTLPHFFPLETFQDLKQQVEGLVSYTEPSQQYEEIPAATSLPESGTIKHGRRDVPPNPSNLSSRGDFDKKIPSEKSCGVCSTETKAAGYCQTCLKFMCQTHIERHNKSKVFSGHVITHVGAKYRCYCGEHPEEEAVAFCSSCTVPICTICALDSHSEHDAVELAPVIEKAEKDISAFSSECKSQLEALREQLTKIVFVKLNVKRQQDEIIKAVQDDMKRVKTKLESEFTDLLLELDKKCEGILQKADSKAQILAASLSKVEATFIAVDNLGLTPIGKRVSTLNQLLNDWKVEKQEPLDVENIDATYKPISSKFYDTRILGNIMYPQTGAQNNQETPVAMQPPKVPERKNIPSVRKTNRSLPALPEGASHNMTFPGGSNTNISNTSSNPEAPDAALTSLNRVPPPIPVRRSLLKQKTVISGSHVPLDETITGERDGEASDAHVKTESNGRSDGSSDDCDAGSLASGTSTVSVDSFEYVPMGPGVPLHSMGRNITQGSSNLESNESARNAVDIASKKPSLLSPPIDKCNVKQFLDSHSVATPNKDAVKIDLGHGLGSTSKVRKIRFQGTVKPGACIEIRDLKIFQHHGIVMTTDCPTKPILVKDFQNKETTVIGHSKVSDPWGVAVDRHSETIAVTDARKSIKVFDKHGNLTLDILKSGNERFKRVVPLSWCASVGVYITSDWDEASILLLDPRVPKKQALIPLPGLAPNTGAAIASKDSPWLPVYLTSDDNTTNIAAINDQNNCVMVFDIRSGSHRVLHELREPDPYNWAPTGVVFDKAGNLLVVDAMGKRIGRFLGNEQNRWQQISTFGAMKGKFWNAIDVTPQGCLAVDTTNRFNDQEISIFSDYISLTSHGELPNSDSEDEAGGMKLRYSEIDNKPDPNVIDWNIPFIRKSNVTGPPPTLDELGLSVTSEMPDSSTPNTSNTTGDRLSDYLTFEDKDLPRDTPRPHLLRRYNSESFAEKQKNKDVQTKKVKSSSLNRQKKKGKKEKESQWFFDLSDGTWL